MTDHLRRAGQVAWAAVGIAALLAVLWFIALKIRVVFPPLLFAGAIVFVLNPVVTRLHRRGVPRAAGAALSYLSVIGVLVLVVLAFRPIVNDQVDQFRDEWPTVKQKVNDWVDARAEDSKGTAIEFTRKELYDQFSSNDLTLRQQIDRARDWAGRALHILLIIVLGPVIGFYLLVDLPHLRRVAESIVPERAKPEVFVVGRRLNRAIGGFLRGQLLVALIVGVLCSIGLLIIGLRFWLLIGMIAGLFNVVPLIGPWIGGVPGVIVALTTGDFSQAIGVVIVMVAAQQIDNHFITPQVMQRAVKLHPAAVILALLAGGSIGGFAGLLIAVPAAAVLKIIVSDLWRVHILGEPLEAFVAEVEAEDAQPGAGLVRDVTAETAGAVADRT